MSHQLLKADARRIPLADASVNCCVTSPPYFGLRDYGAAGQIGLEPNPAAYVAAMVAVFREVRRVLADDGTLWLNIGDCYNGGGIGGDPRGSTLVGASNRDRQGEGRKTTKVDELKSKDLIGIPWMLAFALRADGWYLRSEVIWHKPNPMPESVTDRPTKAHEQIFLLSKSGRYHYDADAIREQIKTSPHARGGVWSPEQTSGPMDRNGSSQYDASNQGRVWGSELGRNVRSVWSINVGSFPGAHFATFPPEIPERCIKAGCPEGGVVLDPFNGAGTTGVVATGLGRRYVGLDINPDYLAMSARRIARPHSRLRDGSREEVMPLFADAKEDA